LKNKIFFLYTFIFSTLGKYILFWALTAVRTDATVKLYDFTNAVYIPIEDGDIVVWESYGYLQHATNMTTYEVYADQTETLTKTFTDDHRIPVITTDLRHIRKLVPTLKIHHRAARSINLIRTALEVIPGTPHFNDWEQIKFNRDQLLRADEGQTYFRNV